MLSFISRIIARFRPPVTVDSILAGFNKTVAKLDQHAAAQETVAKVADATISKAQSAKSLATHAASRARHVRAKIADLVG